MNLSNFNFIINILQLSFISQIDTKNNYSDYINTYESEDIFFDNFRNNLLKQTFIILLFYYFPIVKTIKIIFKLLRKFIVNIFFIIINIVFTIEIIIYFFFIYNIIYIQIEDIIHKNKNITNEINIFTY